jgi:hypothetical protein
MWGVHWNGTHNDFLGAVSCGYHGFGVLEIRGNGQMHPRFLWALPFFLQAWFGFGCSASGIVKALRFSGELQLSQPSMHQIVSFILVQNPTTAFINWALAVVRLSSSPNIIHSCSKWQRRKSAAFREKVLIFSVCLGLRCSECHVFTLYWSEASATLAQRIRGLRVITRRNVLTLCARICSKAACIWIFG